eukprot:COSAG01_NODE_1971_length_8759_cov_19.618014_1_plen_234_part_00
MAIVAAIEPVEAPSWRTGATGATGASGAGCHTEARVDLGAAVTAGRLAGAVAGAGTHHARRLARKTSCTLWAVPRVLAKSSSAAATDLNSRHTRRWHWVHHNCRRATGGRTVSWCVGPAAWGALAEAHHHRAHHGGGRARAMARVAAVEPVGTPSWRTGATGASGAGCHTEARVDLGAAVTARGGTVASGPGPAAWGALAEAHHHRAHHGGGRARAMAIVAAVEPIGASFWRR